MAQMLDFGPYRLIRKIGAGGMAEVFLATPQGEQRMVALKRMLRKYMRQEDIVALFVQESELALRLEHPNIVEAFDVGAVGSRRYICMEYLAGVDLSLLMRYTALRGRGGLPPRIAVALAAAVCRGLHYAHELRDERGRLLNIVNRDIDPSNVRVTFDGRVKLIDFGVARAATGQRTEIGQVRGKFAYMSPEQARCMPLDRRSDVFSVGVVLHELLTAKRLFQGQVVDTMERVKQATVVPPSTINRRVPRAVDEVLLKAVQRSPGDRYPSAAAFAHALEELGATLPEAPTLAALVRDYCKDEWHEELRRARAFEAGESLMEQDDDVELEVTWANEGAEGEQASADVGDEGVPPRGSPPWMYWLVAPTLLLFILALYLVLRGPS